jgi:hypothetical protein
VETTRDRPVAAWVTFGSALTAAALLGVSHLGFGQDAAESLFVTTYLLGWALVFWTALGGAYVGVQTVRRALVRRLHPLEGVLLVLSVAVLVAVVVGLAPAGQGSGTA